MKIGYNILATGYAANLVEDIKAADADYHLVMTVPPRGVDGAQDLETYRWWAEHVAPAKLVRRTFNTNEGNWTRYMSPKEQVALWVKQGLFWVIHDDPVNEPALSSSNETEQRDINKRYVARQVDLLKRAADAHIVMAAGAFSVGLPNERYIEQGVYDDFIRATIDGGHYLSAHLYGWANPAFGETLPYSSILDFVPVDGIQWPFGKQYRYWLHRRPDYFIHRSIELGYNVNQLKILATEALIDQIANGQEWANKVSREYKMQEMNYDLRGMVAWKKYLAKTYPDKTLSQAVAHVLKYWRDKVVWPKNYEGAMLFTINPDWDTPEGSNYGSDEMFVFRKQYLPALNRDFNREEKVVFPEKSDMSLWQEGNLIIEGSTKNIRTAPVDNKVGTDIGDIPVGVYAAKRSKTFLMGGGYKWYAYQIVGFPDFWLAHEVSRWEDKVLVPKEYVLDFGHGTITYSESELKGLIMHYDRVLNELRNLLDNS